MRTGEPRGFAFVRFLDQRDADDAMDGLDGERLAGRELRIQVHGGLCFKVTMCFHYSLKCRDIGLRLGVGGICSRL